MTSPVDIAASPGPGLAGSDVAAGHDGAGREAVPIRARPAHAEFLRLPFCLLNLEQTVRLIVDECQGPFAYVVTPNAQHVVAVHEQPEPLSAIYRNAWLSLCDSQIIRA